MKRNPNESYVLIKTAASQLEILSDMMPQSKEVPDEITELYNVVFNAMDRMADYSSVIIETSNKVKKLLIPKSESSTNK